MAFVFVLGSRVAKTEIRKSSKTVSYLVGGKSVHRDTLEIRRSLDAENLKFKPFIFKSFTVKKNAIFGEQFYYSWCTI